MYTYFAVVFRVTAKILIWILKNTGPVKKEKERELPVERMVDSQLRTGRYFVANNTTYPYMLV